VCKETSAANAIGTFLAIFLIQLKLSEAADGTTVSSAKGNYKPPAAGIYTLGLVSVSKNSYLKYQL
jgi:hypothetical protein